MPRPSARRSPQGSPPLAKLSDPLPILRTAERLDRAAITGAEPFGTNASPGGVARGADDTFAPPRPHLDGSSSLSRGLDIQQSFDSTPARRRILPVLAFSLVVAFATASSGVPLTGGTHFVFTSGGGGLETSGDPANTADGQSLNGGFGDQTIGVQYRFPPSSLPITFTYTFTQVVDVSGDFTLYNGWDLQNQGIDQFTLTFFDSSQSQIGSPFGGSAPNAPPTATSFALGTTFAGAKTVELTVTSVHSGEQKA